MDSKLKNLQVATTISQTAIEHSLSISGKIFTDEDPQTILKQWREKSKAHEHYSQSSNENYSERISSSSSILPAEEIPQQKMVSQENTSSCLSKSSRVLKNNSLFIMMRFPRSDDCLSIVRSLRFWFLIISNVIILFHALM